MKILCVGDVVGSAGCAHLRKTLPGIKRLYGVDVCIVNGENAADGNGMTPAAAEHILDSGADVITGGNHTFRRRELYDVLDKNPALLRPANYPPSAPGRGLCMVDRGRYQVAVINLIGVVYMEPLACPFDTLDRLLREAGNPRFCVVDFHAEATAEKKALAYYADGRISALVGTHTHVQTADEQILPQGTGFLTDVGMTGPLHSVLGVKPEQSIAKMHGKLPVRFSTAEGPCRMDAVLLTLDDASGKAVAVERVNVQ
ncbi:MAG TPA: TIGR00282 family metallophosphoesterase [Firmicutes bacterium]|nr:TIGR00282 family metallophosphoesterase [Bacillota bacterium]